jgi:gliding motility-associated-like protein
MTCDTSGTYIYAYENGSSCPSTDTLHLTVNYGTHNVETETACESYTWHGEIYTETGTYIYDYTNADFCSSTDTLYLTINNPQHQSITDTAYDSYVWHGETYTQSGDHLYAHEDINGCEQVDTLHLTVYYSSAGEFGEVACEQYQWNDSVYTVSGDYTQSFHDVNGADSVVTLHLTVNYGSHNTFTKTACDHYIWHEEEYPESGVYRYEYVNDDGCPSTDTLHLTINHGTHNVETETACESYIWHGETYTVTGTYTYSYTNGDGCPSVDTLHLTVNHGTHNVTDTTVCESYTWHGETYTITGSYTYAYTNAVGCPSVDTLHLTVNHFTESTLFDTVVENALPYVLNDSSYMQSGIYQQTLANMAGCDSLLTLHLTVLNNVFTSVDSIVCASALPLVWNGVTFTEAGVYYDTLTAANGADSVVAMTLQVIPLPVISHSPDLTVPPCSSVTLWASGADFLTWTDADGYLLGGGETLTVAPVQSSATYYISGFNEGVVEDMNVVINGDFEQGNTSFTSAYRYSTSLGPEGTYYVDANAHDHHSGFTGAHDHTTGSGLYMMVNGAGTPNTVIWQQTVTVQPNTSYAFSVWVNTLSPYSEQYLSRLQFSINGEQIGEVFRSPLTLNTWSQFYQVWYSGTNSQATITILNQNTALAGNDFGIDDISFVPLVACYSTDSVHVEVLGVTDTTILTETACDFFVWFGDTLTETGEYPHTLINEGGCDSVVTLRLTVKPSVTELVEAVACGSYTWNGVTYYESGEYTQTFTAANGCDSVVTLNLTINHGTHNVETETACESYEWHGETYTTTGTYTYSYTNGDGCPSVDTLRLTVGTPTESTISVVVLENNLPFTLNDSSYTIPGTYYQHFTNAAGCDSTLTIELAVYYNQTIEVDSTVCQNELPLTWNSVTFTQAGTLSDTLSTSHGADSIVVMTLNVLPSPEAAISGLMALCSDSVVTLTADSALSYLWSTGDTTRTITVSEEGTYTLTVTNEYGCVATVNHPVMALNNPILSVTAPGMCAGGSYTFSVGYQPSNNIHLGQGATTLSLTDTIFLPDGIYCEPFGCSYHSPLTFTAYSDDDTIRSADDIYYVRLNMEHSFVGDLYINITCPNGQKADLLKYGGTGNSTCNSQIVNSSRGWAAGSNMNFGNFFGDAHDYSVASCDATVFGNEPGVGWNYCWSDNTTQGYVYAQGDGLIYRYGNAHEGRVDSSDVAAGTQFYHPDNSFNNLIGCPLNGSWYIEVQDGWSMDNGYIFGWELSLSNEMLPDVSFDLDYSTAEGPWITTLSDTLFQIDPPADLAHDTTIAYTFTVYDTTGCGYDTTFHITFYATPHTEFDTMVCGSFTWNDSVYTQSGQYVQYMTNAAGCDSVVTCQLTVSPLSSTYDTLTLVENELPYYFAPTNTTFTMQTPLVSSITYTLTSSQGCDSVVEMTVYIYHNAATQVDTTICAANLPITWRGHNYTAAGSFTTTLLASNGADSVVTYTLSVDEIAATIPTVTHVTCFGGSNGAATATVTGGMPNFAYAWTNAAGTNVSTSTSISNQPEGTYNFTVTDIIGCTATATVTLNAQNDALQPGTIAEDQVVCEGEQPLPFTGTVASGGDNGAYQWQISTNGTDWTAAPGTSNMQNYTYPDVPTSGFSLRRAWESQSCGTVYSNIVTINLWPNSSDTIEVAVCVGDIYQENGFNITADQTEEAGVYTFEQHFPTGNCDSMVMLILTVNPHYEIELEDVVCEGEGYRENGFNINPLETVGTTELTRTLNLHTAAGCDSTVTVHLRIIDTALSIISLTPDFCENLSAELQVVTDMPNYVWSTGETSPSIFVTHSGRYYVTATSGDCSNTAFITIENCDGNQLLLPNAITPSNYDGLNDYFSIPERNLLYINLFEIWIYNRWGELVYYSNDKNFRWNGECRGEIQYQTVYNYIIRYTDDAGKPYFVKGSVTVL